MESDISSPVPREDVSPKIAGDAKYVGDYRIDGMLYAKTFRSTEARAKIKSLKYPHLPDGYFIVDKTDVPGRNMVKQIDYDQPFFAEEIVNYIGEPIALVVGKDKNEILNILSNISIEYERLEAVKNIEDGIKAKFPVYGKENTFADYKIVKGDIEFARVKARYVYEGEYQTGYQEQFYLEPQGVIATYENGRITIYGSMQCPYYIKGAVEECLGLSPEKVRIIQATTGGGFGGKEDYPSILAGQAACAALKTTKPVCLILERDEDLEYTTKRHPADIKLRSYIGEDFKVLGMEARILLDAGAYSGLTAVVLQRAMFASAGVYNIENIILNGKAVATNKAVSGAFRGFGAPQAFFAIEMHMEHIAKKLGIDPLDFKRKNLLRKGDKSTTGGSFREKIVLPEMIEKAFELSSYREKKKYFKAERSSGRLRGIGLSMFFHGGGFTGNGERDLIRGRVKLVKNNDSTVELLVSNVEMGQGAQTTLRKIAAKTLGITMDRIIFANPDTDRVPDSGPTVASRTTVIVGKLIEDAAQELKSRWNEQGKAEVVIDYKYPEGFSWDAEKFQGDAYTTYSWGVNVVEIEMDPLTYESKITGVWSVYDIGKAIDERIVKGQIDGGIVQGLGYGYLEVIENKEGRFLQRTAADCIIPGAKDVPEIKSELICEPFEGGPFGAKALGELTLIGSAAAYALAVEDALEIEINKIPVRPEHLMEVLHNDNKR